MERGNGQAESIGRAEAMALVVKNGGCHHTMFLTPFAIASGAAVTGIVKESFEANGLEAFGFEAIGFEVEMEMEDDTTRIFR